MKVVYAEDNRIVLEAYGGKCLMCGGTEDIYKVKKRLRRAFLFYLFRDRAAIRNIVEETAEKNAVAISRSTVRKIFIKQQ